MRRSSLSALAVLVTLTCAPSFAQGEAPAPAPPPAPAPAPAPAPPAPAQQPVEGVLTITPEKVNGREASVLAGDQWRVRGNLTPYVAGQRVAVRFYRGGKKIAVKNVLVQPSSTGSSGGFAVSFTTKRPGRITVRASHRATPELATAVAPERTVDVLPLRASQGSTGTAVRVLQQRLARHGYVVGKRGVFDARTARAVLAFRKNVGIARTMVADADVFRRLARGEGRFRVRFPQHGRHIEADISKQVMALIGAGGKVERIYHVSSGKPSTPTILGSFRVYRRDIGTLASGMVHSVFFRGGYAIHGYKSVPTFNASAGCLRVPTPDALAIRNWTRMGMIIDTYR